MIELYEPRIAVNFIVLVIAVETIWSLAKRHWMKLLVVNERPLTLQATKDLVRRALSYVTDA